ncbi:hypothetical protein [Kurthia sp. Dielmo]|uniref:hypothetical protein n=1 Tax=Kurthia sp. Dielmo TaxID=1033738 RepID=UPI00112279B9|nr:hypothetical protein [Kurthia sp. Dielmo]
MNISPSVLRSFKKTGALVTAGATILDYGINKAQGKSTMEAAGSAAGTAVMSHFLPWYATFALQAHPLLKGAVGESVREVDMKSRDFARNNQAFSNSYFSDNSQTFTMRQAGMASIERAKYNQQNAMLGSEAKYMNY